MPTPGGFKAKPAPKPRPSSPKPRSMPKGGAPKPKGEPRPMPFDGPRPQPPTRSIPFPGSGPKSKPPGGKPPAKMFPPYKPVGGPLGPGSSDVDAGHISLHQPMVRVAKAKP